MSKFVIVDKAPDEVRPGEYVIEQPTFLEEIEANATKAPRSGLTGHNHLRSIVEDITDKYDRTKNGWSVRPHLYEGRLFKSNEDLSAIVVDMMKSQCPSVFEGYLNAKIAARPQGTKVIYYVGTLGSSGPLDRAGFELIKEKDIEVALGLKAKKVVGKPAVSNESAGE